MQQQQSLCKLRDWLFKRMVAVLLNDDWVIEIRDFSKSKKRKYRKISGLTCFKTKTIFVDKKGPHLLILCHELGHVVFQKFLLQEAKIKRKKWAEDRVMEWEKCFLGSLNVGQKEILKMFISIAKKGL